MDAVVAPEDVFWVVSCVSAFSPFRTVVLPIWEVLALKHELVSILNSMATGNVPRIIIASEIYYLKRSVEAKER
jgi:hypothetical protein